MPADTPPVAMRCGVIGSPIGHSLSPVLHSAAYRALGLDWTYTAHEVDEAALAGFVASLTGSWRGLSVTMPLKRAVIGWCDQVENRAQLLRSVNTLVLEPHRRSGYNTDVPGFVAAFRSFGVEALQTVLVVGGGATAASALAAVAELGASYVTVLTRTPARAAWVEELGPRFGLDVRLRALGDAHTAATLGGPAGGYDAVVSTVPVEGQAGVAATLATLSPVVFDVVYDPRDTPLTHAAALADALVIGGFELLLQQAARQVELMTGTAEAPLKQMRAAGLEVLDRA